MVFAIPLIISLLQILIPVEYCDTFILIVLDQDTRTLYVLDPTPIDPIYENNPNARYVKQLLCIAEYLAKAMAKVCLDLGGTRISTYGGKYSFQMFQFRAGKHFF